MRSLLHPPPTSRARLPGHHGSLNLLRDPSMKRHMEEICGRRHSVPYDHRLGSVVSMPWPSSTRSHSATAGCADSSVQTSIRLASTHSVAELAKLSCASGGWELDEQGARDPEPGFVCSCSSSCEDAVRRDDEHDKDHDGDANTPLPVDKFDTPSLTSPAGVESKPIHQGENKMLAAVDMGTNSFHMVVVKADCQGGFQVVDSEKEYVRLGSGGFGLSLITPEAEARALEAIKRFKKLAEVHKAPMRIVATSAVREARNRGMFLRNIFEKAGVEVEVLSGKDEACLIYLGVLQALPVYDKMVLTIDIGGGSTEFVLGRAGKPVYATSLKLGHIRLTELFVGSGNEPLQKSQLDDLRKHVRIAMAESGVLDQVHNVGFELAIGSSGTIETIEQIVNQGYAVDFTTLTEEQSHLGLHAFREREFTHDELTVVVRKLCKARSNEQRARLLGLPEKRTEVLVGGAILLEEIFKAMGIQRMRVSPYALREGVIVDTLAKTCNKYEPTPSLRWSSVINLARKFNTEHRLISASHSTRLAKEILAGLKTCKTGSISEVALLLDDTDTELMEAAVTLHHLGIFISHKNYHKHSHYLIKNNEHLVGYSPMEVEIIALLAKYHRKKVPGRKDEDFAQLPADVQRKTRALCAIIRIAIALNRCDRGAIENVHVIQDIDRCVLVAVPSLDPLTEKPRDVSLELWAAQDKLEYFEKVFKWKASIVIADQDDENLLKVDEFTSLSS